jgi:hypothetical protein
MSGYLFSEGVPPIKEDLKAGMKARLHGKSILRNTWNWLGISLHVAEAT